MKLYPDILTDEDLRQSPTSVSRPQQLYPSFSRHHRLNRSVNLPPSSPSSPPSPSSSSSSSSFSSSSSSSASPIPSITTSDSRSTFSSVDTALTSASGGGGLTEEQQQQQPRYDKNHNPIGGSRAGSLPTIIYHEIYSKESSRNGGNNNNNNSNSHSSRFFTLDRSFGERHQFQQSFEKKAPLPVESISEDDGQSSGSELTLRVAIAALAAFLTSSLPSGFNMGVVNTPEATFKDFFNYTLSLSRRSVVVVDRSQIELLWSVAVSLLLVGAFIGCTFTGYLADRIGRRGLLILNALLGLLGAALCWMAKFLGPSFSLPVFITGRFISGLHTGVGSSLVPMYLIEIAPKKGGSGGGLATALGVLHVIGLNGGQMVAMTLGLQSVLGSSTRWQLLFAVNGAFIVSGLVLLLLLSPESPTYLYVLRRNEPKAISALLALRGKGSVLELLDEVAAMRLEAKSRQSGNHQLSIFTILKNSRRFRAALAVVCALHAGQQLAGINAVFYYSTKTFRSVGLADLTAQYSSIGCTALNTAMALVAVALIRRFSSRTLLLTSGLATSLCLLLLTLCMSFQAEAWLNFATIAIILAYVLFFAIGQGPIPFMIGGELFDQSTMAIGMSIGCFVNWFCNFLIAITFPMIAMLINQYVFLLFLAFNLLLLVFVYLKVSPRKSVEAGNGGCGDLEDGDQVVTEKQCSSAKERTLGGVA